jgi:Ras-related protein Rab-5C
MNVNKIAIVGDPNVGKTTFVHKFMNNNYVYNYIPTIGVEINTLGYSPNKYVIWDVSGQEKFTNVEENVRVKFMERLNKYVKDSKKVLVFFDTTVKKTYVNALTWAEKVRELYPTMPLTFIGTKIDNNPKESNKYCVDQDIFMNKFQAEFYEISNRTGLGMNNSLSKFL